jgi:hypothetical protein
VRRDLSAASVVSAAVVLFRPTCPVSPQLAGGAMADPDEGGAEETLEALRLANKWDPSEVKRVLDEFASQARRRTSPRRTVPSAARVLRLRCSPAGGAGRGL